MAAIPGTQPIFGPIIDMLGEDVPPTTTLRDAGALSLRSGKIQKVNAAGDAWIDFYPVSHDKFTQHTDTPGLIGPREMLMGNNAGTALEFQRLPEYWPGIKRVTVIPSALDRPLLNLLYDQYQSTGSASDVGLTPGRILTPRFIGYSDGTLKEAVGTLGVKTNRTGLAWLEGTGTLSSSNVITQWRPTRLGSLSESWIKSIGNIWLDGWRYVVTNPSYYNGGWEAEIVGARLLLNANQINIQTDIKVGQRATTGAHSWLATNTLLRRAGLYWWTGTEYKLLEAPTARFTGAFSATADYQAGDMYTQGAIIHLVTVKTNTATTTVQLNVADVVDVTGSGHPAIDVNNRDKLFVDHDAPMLWVPHWIPQATVPATATSTPWVHAKFDGARIFEPVESESAIGDIFYNTARSIWEKRVTNTGTAGRWELSGITAATSNKVDFPGTFVWLSQQVNANAAANRILGNAIVANHTYLYLNLTTDKVEEITGSTFTPAGSPGYDYESEPVQLAKDVEAWAKAGATLPIPIGKASNMQVETIEQSFSVGTGAFTQTLKITPRSLASKILVEVSGGQVILGGATAVTMDLFIKRGNTTLATVRFIKSVGDRTTYGVIAGGAIDSPGSLAEQTYSLSSNIAGTTSVINNVGGNSDSPLLFKATELG